MSPSSATPTEIAEAVGAMTPLNQTGDWLSNGVDVWWRGGNHHTIQLTEWPRTPRYEVRVYANGSGRLVGTFDTLEIAKVVLLTAAS